MWWMTVLAAQVVAAEPCEAPRVRDTAALMAATAQDRVLAQTFTKAATSCAAPGEACTAARLECTTLLNSTIQKQVSFDEGMWLRDMLLPYLGGSYPMTTVFGAAGLAGDASCNVDGATLTAAAQRRTAQATRRDQILKEYAGYAKWADGQWQKCKERVSAEDVKSAQARAEAERLAAAAAAATAADAAKQKAAQEAAQAAAQAKADQERRAREAADAEAKRAQDAKTAEERRLQESRDLAARELKRREDAEAAARDEREALRKREEERLAATVAQARQDKEDAELRAREEREAQERQRLDAEEDKKVKDRDSRVSQQRALKDRLVKEAEDNLKRAKDEESLKKQAALDAVSSSPAIAQAAVAEAAQAERGRVEAEKKLVQAHQQADSIVVDDSHERASGAVYAAGGGVVFAAGGPISFGPAVQVGVHFGFWGRAPSEGMASGLELRIWGRYTASVLGTVSRTINSMVTARYHFGVFGVGVAGELMVGEPDFGTVRGGGGPSLGLALVDSHDLRAVIGASWLPVGNTIDLARVVGEIDLEWKFLEFRVVGGSSTATGFDGATVYGWQVGGLLGARLAW